MRDGRRLATHYAKCDRMREMEESDPLKPSRLNKMLRVITVKTRLGYVATQVHQKRLMGTSSKYGTARTVPA